MNRRIHKLLYELLILVLFIIVFYSVFGAYFLVKNLLFSRPSYKYEKKMETPTNDDGQIVEFLMSPNLSKNPDRKIKQKTFENLPWYFKDGMQVPNKAKVDPKTGVRISRIWPEEKKDDDRVEEQLMFIPPNYQYENARMKNILLFNGISNWVIDIGQSEFLSNDCPVNRCKISTKINLIYSMDAILFQEKFYDPFSGTGYKKRSEQIWILFNLQSAYYSGFEVRNDMINWTATYRHDSDIVIPYGRWAYFDPSVTRVEQLNRNYSLNKTKQVAMIVSNCVTDNERLLYAKKLGKYISVDVYYGQCEELKTSKSDNFLQILDQDYKFYLAFENSNCNDYVTETFFIDGLQHNVLPVVMGGRRDDYERIAPKRSYLHVHDFESPKRLAEYLRWLDANDDVYNEYFRWKGTGEFIDTKFFCRLCAMLHDDHAPAKHYPDLERWWRPPGVCHDSTKGLKSPPVE